MKTRYNVVCPNLEAAAQIKKCGRLIAIYDRLEFYIEVKGEEVDDFEKMCGKLKVEFTYL